eukprot:gene8669-8851_t
MFPMAPADSTLTWPTAFINHGRLSILSPSNTYPIQSTAAASLHSTPSGVDDLIDLDVKNGLRGLLAAPLVNSNTARRLLQKSVSISIKSGGGDKKDDGDGKAKGSSESKPDSKSDSKASVSLKCLHPFAALFLAKLGGC